MEGDRHTHREREERDRDRDRGRERRRQRVELECYAYGVCILCGASHSNPYGMVSQAENVTLPYFTA